MSKKNKLSLEEQETIIVYDRAGDTAEVYTCEPSLIRKLNKFSSSEEVSQVRQDSQSLTMIIPKVWVKIKKPTKRKLTDEHRQAISERLKK